MLQVNNSTPLFTSFISYLTPQQAKAIDKAEVERKTAKILLLETSNAGKSTFLKQLIAISTKKEDGGDWMQSMDSFLPYEIRNSSIQVKEEYLLTSCPQNCPDILRELTNLGCARIPVDLVQDIDVIHNEFININSDKQGKSIRIVVSHDSIKKLAMSDIIYHLPSNAPYYLEGDRIKALFTLGYKLTFEDLIHLRGQTNERKKWLHLFEDVIAVVYLQSN